jgi:hypothetical protein
MSCLLELPVCSPPDILGLEGLKKVVQWRRLLAVLQ